MRSGSLLDYGATGVITSILQSHLLDRYFRKIGDILLLAKWLMCRFFLQERARSMECTHTCWCQNGIDTRACIGSSKG